MMRVAIIGGGLSGLTAAYELEKARKAGASLDWHLYEATDRLGGIVETERVSTSEGDYILEGGPDGWVTEKPWARELAIELGLESELIYSNDATRRTYILLDGQLQAIPDRMRLMVAEDLATLEGSPLFSSTAKQAYTNELARAEELKIASPLLDPTVDESVARFVFRHFGEEVLAKLAAPLLSGVFGGDVHKLSVRAVMPQFVGMEREHGSLVLALQNARRERRDKPQQPIFTSLRRGVGSLIEALAAAVPHERVHLRSRVTGVERALNGYEVNFELGSLQLVDRLILATPLDLTVQLASGIEPHPEELASCFPKQASSAVLVSLTWSTKLASTFAIPSGFGFLVPEHDTNQGAPFSAAVRPPAERDPQSQGPQLLACTFVDQKFPDRAPAAARILRAFFGSRSAAQLAESTDEQITNEALIHLRAILGPLPAPQHASVRRWPRSLPQYEVGHLERMVRLNGFIKKVPGLTLLGNSYRGVGLPDLIRDARLAARAIAQSGLTL